AWAGKLDATILPVGAAEFFAAILEPKARGEVRPVSAPVLENGPTLFVCGSMSASTQNFLSECRQRGWPVLSMPDDVLRRTAPADESVAAWAKEITAALARQRRVVVTIEKSVTEVEPARLTELLVAGVAAVLRETPVAQINAEGGATAVALMQAMGWNRLQVLREVSQGVVTLRVGQGGIIARRRTAGS
ncbi:MAG: hypothetical protein NTZ16_01030, partial [Verrucomicrobia bacterium]|nr:hypothetical protein [Verrucomicrobiota bacterium]